MGQKYRYDPETGRCDYQEPPLGQLDILRKIEASPGRFIVVHYIGGHTPYRALLDRGFVRRRGREVDLNQPIELTDLGRAELKHQRDRAAFAEKVGLPNTPQLAKLMYAEAFDDNEEGA